MKARVTEECIACELCTDNCPEVFQMGNDGIAHAIVDTVPAELEDAVRQAAEDCPTDAIIVEE